MRYSSVKRELNICTNGKVLALIQVHGIYNNDCVFSAGRCMQVYRASHHLSYFDGSVDSILTFCQQGTRRAWVRVSSAFASFP